MIAIIVLANTSLTSHYQHFFFVLGIIKIWSVSKFYDYHVTLWCIITILIIRAPGLICLLVFSLKCRLSISSTHQSLVTTILLSVSTSLALFLDSNFKWYHTVFVFLWLISLSIMLSRSILIVKKMGIFLSFSLLLNISLCWPIKKAEHWRTDAF